MDTKNPPPVARGRHVPGLHAFICSGRTILGVVSKDQDRPGFTRVEDAIDIRYQQVQGRGVMLQHVPLLPAQAPWVVYVPPAVHMCLEDDHELGEYYSQATARRGIILPGGPA